MEALGWLRRNGAQVVNVSATAEPSRALVESLRALQLSGALVVAAVGNGGSVAERPGSRPRSPACSASASSQPRSSTQVCAGVDARLAVVDLVAPAEGIKVVASSAAREDRRDRDHPRRHVVRGAARDGRRGDGVGDAPRLDGGRGRKCARAQRHAARRGWCRTATPATASAQRAARRCARRSFPTRTSRTTGSRPRSAQRPLRPGSVVVASLGWAGDTRRRLHGRRARGHDGHAPCCARGGHGLTLRRLPIAATDAVLTGRTAQAPGRARQIAPACRPLAAGR